MQRKKLEDSIHAAQINNNVKMVRLYEQNDWASICRIHDKARIDELKNSVGLDAYLTLEQTYQSEGLFDGDVWVYELENKVIGFMSINDNDLTWLYVLPEHYKQGIGKALLQKAIEVVDDTLFTEVLCGNDVALNFYLNQGFKIVQKTKGKLAGNEIFEAEAFYLKRENRKN
jgi:GNAT superfamily N-acetyltransferase